MVANLLIALLLQIFPQFSCSSSGLSSFGLSYNGGRIMTEPVTASILWFGTGWPESGRETVLNAVDSLTSSRYNIEDSEVPTLGNWWEIVRQYRDSYDAKVTDRVNVGAECFYSGNQVNITLEQVVDISLAVFNRTSIYALGANLNCTRVFEVSDNGVYHIMFSQNVLFLDQREQRQLVDLCSGSVLLNVSDGARVKMAWTRAPQKSDDPCSTLFHGESYLGPPNGDERIDSLVGYFLADLVEQVTNKDGRGWISNGSGMTVSSSCASPFQRNDLGRPLFMDVERNVSFNVIGLNGYRYMVQYIWDQNIRNCALKLSETCGSGAVIVKQPVGYLKVGVVVNHTDGLQPYPPNQKCQWKIQLSTAKFISFTLNYYSVAKESDDNLLICQSDSSKAQCSNILSDDENSRTSLKLMGSEAYIQFTTTEHITFESRGWELSYSAGFCIDKEDIYEHDGSIGYASSSIFSYVKGVSCQWILHGKSGTPVSLNLTHLNISKGLDFLAIYDETRNQIANFSGFYLGSNLPQLNLTGTVTIIFATQTNEGEGWSANFYISSPVDHGKRVLLLVSIVVISVVGVSFSVAFIVLAILKRTRSHRTTAKSPHASLMLVRVKIHRQQDQIGEGPSAMVYKAVLSDGSLVAIKSPRAATSKTKLEEEILLKASSHPSIISFVGHAQDGRQKQYLVFELMASGNLNKNLTEFGETLNWEKRLNIALQISSAIQMLHMYLKPPIFHGNITSDNILIDERFNAKLAGFGAANYCRNSRANQQHLSEMAEDMWSFGLLLVELLRGKPLENRNAYKNLTSMEEIDELVGRQECFDKTLEIPVEESKIIALMKFGDIARWCITSSWIVEGDKNYPKIGDVLSSLKQVKELFCCVIS